MTISFLFRSGGSFGVTHGDSFHLISISFPPKFPPLIFLYFHLFSCLFLSPGAKRVYHTQRGAPLFLSLSFLFNFLFFLSVSSFLAMPHSDLFLLSFISFLL